MAGHHSSPASHPPAANELGGSVLPRQVEARADARPRVEHAVDTDQLRLMGAQAAHQSLEEPYALRHTFATEAIHALVPSFIARVRGTSEAMLRKHYGHLLPDTDDLVRERLDAHAMTEKRAFGHGEGTGQRLTT